MSNDKKIFYDRYKNPAKYARQQTLSRTGAATTVTPSYQSDNGFPLSNELPPLLPVSPPPSTDDRDLLSRVILPPDPSSLGREPTHVILNTPSVAAPSPSVNPMRDEMALLNAVPPTQYSNRAPLNFYSEAPSVRPRETAIPSMDPPPPKPPRGVFCVPLPSSTDRMDQLAQDMQRLAEKLATVNGKIETLDTEIKMQAAEIKITKLHMEMEEAKHKNEFTVTKIFEKLKSPDKGKEKATELNERERLLSENKINRVYLKERKESLEKEKEALDRAVAVEFDIVKKENFSLLSLEAIEDQAKKAEVKVESKLVDQDKANIENMEAEIKEKLQREEERRKYEEERRKKEAEETASSAVCARR